MINDTNDLFYVVIILFQIVFLFNIMCDIDSIRRIIEELEKIIKDKTKEDKK